MKIKEKIVKNSMMLLVFTFICGFMYTGIVNIAAQLFFPKNANGRLIEIDGIIYGSEQIGQLFTADGYLWGRIMNVDINTYKDEEGASLMYASPSNLSPASEEYEKLVQERIKKIKEADPMMSDTAIPVDLVTCSGSGLDPDISLAAAIYQIHRIAMARNISEQEVEFIIKACTTYRFLGIFGEETVNVLKVNMMLDGLLAE